MSTILLVALLLLPVFVLIAVGRNEARRALDKARTVVVEVDDRGVRRRLSDGREEEVRWDEVVAVEAFVANRGPYADAGGAVVLAGDDVRGCVVPFDWLAPSGLLAALWHLPGFDQARLIKAMDGPRHKPVVCWERAEDPG